MLIDDCLLLIAGFGGSVQVKVHRDSIVEDAFLGLRQAGGRLKGRVQVEFMGEAGIDGGGLFKEFIDSFLKTAFNPALGLFCPTSAQLLVPSPSSSQNAEAIAFATSEREGKNETISVSISSIYCLFFIIFYTLIPLPSVFFLLT